MNPSRWCIVGALALVSSLAIAAPTSPPATPIQTERAPSLGRSRGASEAPAEGEQEAEAADAPEEATPSEPSEAPTADSPPERIGPPIVDIVLPCGLRVIAAEDSTLPVAAVVLSIETGPEDDPANLPGLTHALAFHLTHGNRELSPGGAAAMVHDGGGVTGFAVGQAQLRYEALVPVSLVGDAIWIESQRLRAPTVSEQSWRQSLAWARHDRSRSSPLPPPLLAAIHGVAELGHDGRAVPSALEKLAVPEIAAALAQRFRYDRASLIVVAPGPPEATLATVQAAFADLPPRPRSVRERQGPPTASDAQQVGTPRPSPAGQADGSTLGWPVAPDPEASAWARVWCRTLNRQRRDASEPPKARVHCDFDPDPRRGTLVVRVRGTEDPRALLAGRLARATTGSDRALLQRQREEVWTAMARELRTSLPLARRLAAAPDTTRDEGAVRVGLDQLTGRAALRPDADEPAPMLSLAQAVHLVPPSQP